MTKIKNIIGHFKTVHMHRKWVRHYCFLAGIPWRGMVHDLSKYMPTEFWESVKYYTGTSSPINGAKKAQGYSRAWLHHRGRNKHHWAYWADNFSEGFTVYPMPEKYFVEMVCDFLGAGRAYFGDKFTYEGEYSWWLKDRARGNKAMNPINKKMLDIIFFDLKEAERLYKEIPGASSPEQLIKKKYIQNIYKANNSSN